MVQIIKLLVATLFSAIVYSEEVAEKKGGHHGPELIRHVDGKHGDFYRCPGPKMVCHKKNKTHLWQKHQKRCWVIYKSGQGYCYEWTKDGCHIYKKRNMDNCKLYANE